MTLNQDKVPINLEEALEILKEGLTKKEMTEFKKLDARKLHLDVGGTLRNYWSLWETENIISVWFKNTYDVDHADDVSGIILECLINDLKKEPRNDVALAKKMVEHRKKKL